MSESLLDMLMRHEGLRLHPYQDSVGKTTIGIGRNLDDVGISEDEAYYLLQNDVARVEKEAEDYPWFNDLNEDRKMVIKNMLFNMGKPTFEQFQKMIDALRHHNYDRAAAEMLNSKWARQVGYRARELARLMREG